jgi:hypothetical protein
VAPVRIPDRGYVFRVTGRGEPVVNGGPDLAALDRRLARTVMTRNQEKHAFAARDRQVDAAVDC